ncbi:MAG: glucose 1-dehydrogenase [Candidatus Aminicenantes bacterium]|nr:glucose 1-dehydrogenase [Candidatus Aminicenantes bacterium]
MINLEGKKALITGGSRGIGRATALLFARAGADVAINFLARKEAAEKVREEIGKIGRECLVFKADISMKEDINLMINKVIEKWSRIDILINNAGIWSYGEIGTMPDEVWAETMKINLDGVFYACNAVVPFMKKERRGWIISVSSTAAVRGEGFHSHYAASKGAVVSFTKSLAVELAPYNIRVNCVAPGWVDTDMCTEVFSNPDFRNEVQESIPLKRIPPPEDIAGPILFLASDLACHITGEVLNVNGGSVLCA